MTDEKPGDAPAKEEADAAARSEREPAEADDVQAHVKKWGPSEKKWDSSEKKV